MPLTAAPLISARDVLAMPIRPTLHAQRWTLAGTGGAALGHFVHLAAGRGGLLHRAGEMTLHAQDLVWLPSGQAEALQVAPGSEGIVVGVSASLLTAAIGSHAEAHLLRHLTGHTARMTVHDAGAREEILRSLHAIEAEARMGLEGSWGYLSAHLTIVLVWMWRLGSKGAPEIGAAAGEAQRLQRFRRLVEAHFHEHWSVARYAKALAVTPDRLHDICVRSLGRPPLTLVHQRVTLEACRLLGGSELHIEAVAAQVGFASTSHFSRFFKRWTDVSPTAWRAQARRRARAEPLSLPTSYADWP